MQRSSDRRVRMADVSGRFRTYRGRQEANQLVGLQVRACPVLVRERHLLNVNTDIV